MLKKTDYIAVGAGGGATPKNKSLKKVTYK